ncbi:MAG: leucyl/phenylalanyl-tRNA--protein transferase [Gammaproteobacteria bacterium]|nr:leucyl/phenylalanyl-tRNA--protein transferase [Gammaproteobacteria bacterium]
MVLFPPPDAARPDGLLAIGGDLSVGTLISAYSQGIFPWFNEGQPILWWSPDPRLVLRPDGVRVSRSLRKSLNNKHYRVSFDSDFMAVIRACAEQREDKEGTWINPLMLDAYDEMHRLGWAHSVEVYADDDRLVGGLYGIAIGKVFFGESMFHVGRDASKVALVALCRHLEARGYVIIDCQVHTDHLVSLGAEEIPRARFCDILREHCRSLIPDTEWSVAAPG